MTSLTPITVNELCNATQTPLSSIDNAWRFTNEQGKESFIFLAEAEGYNNGLGFDVPTYFAMTLEDFEDTDADAWHTPFASLVEAFAFSVAR